VVLNATGLLESDAMRTLIKALEERYDRVIIDTPPVNIVTDAAILATRVDGVLVIARAAVTHADALRYAVDQLERVSAPVLGVVLNDIDFRKDAAYDGAYRYYNHNEYIDQSL
jgi:capsular exopolysaccharide synthesis family protein